MDICRLFSAASHRRPLQAAGKSLKVFSSFSHFPTEAPVSKQTTESKLFFLNNSE